MPISVWRKPARICCSAHGCANQPGQVLVPAFGRVVPVAAFSAIVASKRAAGRPQDHAAEAELSRVAMLIARGGAPDYGLEQFVQEQGGCPAWAQQAQVVPTNDQTTDL